MYVGIDPTAGSGPAKLDDDKDALIKITNKATQKFYVRIATKDGQWSKRTDYTLSGLTLAT